MQKANLPITPETFNKFKAFISDVNKRNESGTVINLSRREQMYRVKQLQTSYKSIEIVDLSNPQLGDLEDLHLSKKNKIYFFLNSDSLFEEKRSFLQSLNSLTKELNSTFIFLFQKNITYPWNLEKIASYQFLLQNIFIYPPYLEKDKSQFIIYLENKFNVLVPNKLRNLIKTMCGSNFWIIKEAVRFYAKTKDDQEIFDHEGMNFRLKIIFNELDSIEKSYLTKKIKTTDSLSVDELIVEKYFEQINFSIPLLEKYIKEKIAGKTNLNLDKNNKITSSSLIIDSLFSHKERLALRYFLKNQSIIINREDIAKVIWGKDNNFTDWALDQFIRRLRIKLNKLGLDSKLLKTVKHQGYILVSK